MKDQSNETPQAAGDSGNRPSGRRVASWRERQAMRRSDYELVTDINGVEWEVTERRRTKHGFTVLLGLPPLRHDLLTGGRRLILTPELCNYCYQHRTVRGAQFDLPLSVATVHKLRQSLGLNYSRDIRSLWEAGAEELKKLPLAEIAKRHNVCLGTAQKWRQRLHGGIHRPHNWWHSPEVLETLLSKLTRPEKALKLGISASYVYHLIPRALDFVNQNKAA